MLVNLEQAVELIEKGKVLHIADDESLLNKLPKGKWIAGTTPYFITEQGGVTCKDKLYVDEIDCAVDYKIMVYDKNTIFNVTSDSYENGMTFLVLPFASDVAVFYAKEAPYMDDLLMNPTVGWISGFDLDSDASAKVYDGSSTTAFGDKAVALHIRLPEDKNASLGIVNIFNIENSKDKLEFSEDSLSVKNCLINGKETNLYDYITVNKIDVQFPLVADYNGSLINVSIKSVSAESKTVELYAPVFAGKTYYFASPISDYAASFVESLQMAKNIKPVFSCNCILNYLYGKLEGKSTPPFFGPVTFGEIAYQLLNQTLVYAEIQDK